MLTPLSVNPRTAAQQADLELAGFGAVAVTGLLVLGYFWYKSSKSSITRQVAAEADFERRAGKMRARTAAEYTKEYVPGASKVL